MQPYIFPYIGYFQLIESVEEFMFFDTIQYIRKSWMGRNRLLNIDKNCPFFVRPGIVKPEYGELLRNVRLEKSEAWKDKILEQLKVYINKAPFYDETISLIEEILGNDYNLLVDLNIQSTIKICKALDIKTVFSSFSDISSTVSSDLNKGQWGLEIAKVMDASHYINASGGEDFIISDGFREVEIKLGFIQPNIKPYTQAGKDFIQGLSIIDVLMFNGLQGTLDLIKDYLVKWKN